MSRGSGSPFRAVARRYHAGPRPSLLGSYPALPTPGGPARTLGRHTETGPLGSRKGDTHMITPRQKRSVAALRVALGLIVAGTLAGRGPADAASTQTYPNHKPLSGNYPGSYTTRAADSATTGAAQQYPNPQYPNHKPLRGNYPGSY